MTSQRLLLVFARSPADECRHKPLGGAAPRARTEALHRALLQRTLEAAGAVDHADVRLVTTGALAEARRLVGARVSPARLEVRAQAKGSFGARLSQAVARAFADGYRQVVVVGGDTPALGAAELELAFHQLDDDGARPAAVLGPAPDGGFYLLGLNAFCAAAFDDRFLGTASARVEAERALAAAGFAVAQLGAHADIDSLHDLDRLQSALRGAVVVTDVRLRQLALVLLAPLASLALDPIALRSARLRGPAVARGPPPSAR